jgi:hypothetical protein
MKTYSYLSTPEQVIKNTTKSQCKNGYPMIIKSKEEWKAIAKAVNEGIDAHLEAFTKSSFNAITGEILIHPTELHILLRRLGESDNKQSHSLRSNILQTLNIEEI